MTASRLIWIDCTAGAVAGTLQLSLRPWLADWYALPAGLLLATGLANLGYAAVSFSLAVRQRGGRVPYLRGIAAANVGWGVVCLVAAGLYAGTASALGLAHLVGEGVIVAGLGVLEWRAAGRMPAELGVRARSASEGESPRDARPR